MIIYNTINTTAKTVYYDAMIERVISLLAPHTCIVCNREGSLLCSWCIHDSLPAIPSRCYKCKAQTVDSAVCKKCRLKLAHVWVVTEYDFVAKELVHRLKFERAKAAANIIARQLDETLPYFDRETVVTYVPTASSRIRIRGYDQSQLIAQGFAKQRGLTCRKLLHRYGQQRQVGSGRSARLAQAGHEYKTRKQFDLTDKAILLIDDIVTTGATIESCAALLKQSGTKRVLAAVFAQKM